MILNCFLNNIFFRTKGTARMDVGRSLNTGARDSCFKVQAMFRNKGNKQCLDAYLVYHKLFNLKYTHSLGVNVLRYREANT